jgi:hypothetical protein
MKLTAITISVNYADFLKYSIQYNKNNFDKWIVVTDLQDLETKKLCDENNIICVQTNIFYEGGDFRKYAGINKALELVVEDDWVVFLDGDIILSPYARRIINSLPLDKNKIYGIDRVNCYGFENWVKYQKSNGVLVDNWLLHGNSLEFGARIVHIYGEEGDNGKFTGWKPLGYFQLCHKSQISIYPEGSKDASHGDIAFAKMWDRNNRELIPEILGIHICTKNYESMNWKGRKSDKFDYSIEYSTFNKIIDFIIIKWKSLCAPSYNNKTTCFCKIKKWLDSLFS